MGRKTWESIPPRFRPLRGRLNVVVTRTPTEGEHDAAAAGGTPPPADGPVRAESLPAALAYLEARRRRDGLGRVFVTGGAGIYEAALARPEATRVLLTRVDADFECDTFFPLRLGDGPEADGAWTKASREEHQKWVGEDVPEGGQTENEIPYEFQMWERAGG